MDVTFQLPAKPPSSLQTALLSYAAYHVRLIAPVAWQPFLNLPEAT